jgi:hypothetical protein
MADSQEEADDISLDDTLSSLKRNAKAAEVHYLESLKHFKAFQKRLAKEANEEVPQQPRTRMMKWLTDRGLKVESTFQEFFEAFVEEHKQEHRLDLASRSITLNSAACILFGYKDIQPKVPLYDLLERVTSLYY